MVKKCLYCLKEDSINNMIDKAPEGSDFNNWIHSKCYVTLTKRAEDNTPFYVFDEEQTGEGEDLNG